MWQIFLSNILTEFLQHLFLERSVWWSYKSSLSGFKITDYLTLWSRDLLHNLILVHRVNISILSFRNWMFIDISTNIHSRKNPVHIPHLMSLRSTLILFSYEHLDLPNNIFFKIFWLQFSVHFSCLTTKWWWTIFEWILEK